MELEVVKQKKRSRGYSQWRLLTRLVTILLHLIVLYCFIPIILMIPQPKPLLRISFFCQLLFSDFRTATRMTMTLTILKSILMTNFARVMIDIS